MQEENPETEMRGRELPGGGVVVAVDNGCVVVVGSVSSDGEKGPERCYSIYLLPCLSSVFQLPSLLSFCFLALCFFCFVLAAAVLVVAHGAGGGGKLGRAEGGWETSGSCCDGGSAVVLFYVLCSSLCLSLCLLLLPFLTVQVLLSTTGRTVAAGGGSGGCGKRPQWREK
jgi:hypothetical protein